jgi:hypothetical protein
MAFALGVGTLAQAAKQGIAVMALGGDAAGTATPAPPGSPSSARAERDGDDAVSWAPATVAETAGAPGDAGEARSSDQVVSCEKR